jgi:acyl-CoA thioester hydrolase
MITSEIKIRVLYAHTDKMGVVNNGTYFEYFEAGRNTLLHSINYPYTELEKEQYGLPVIEAYAKYISGAKYDDIVTVKCFLKNIPTVKIKLEYELSVKSKLIATGYTIHSFINLKTMKPVKPPSRFIELLKKILIPLPEGNE